MKTENNTENITFDECVTAIMKSSIPEEVSHIVEREDIDRLDELEKTLQYQVTLNQYMLIYRVKSDTIYLVDLSHKFDPNNLKTPSLQLGVFDDDEHFFILRRNEFGKNNINLFRLLLSFTFKHQLMQKLEDGLENKNIKEETKKI